MKTITIDGEAIALREAEPDDASYVIQTWVRSYRPNSRIASEIYDKGHDNLVRNILRTTRVVVACNPDAETAILGWACGQPGLLHYAYVPAALRHKGLARELIREAIGGYPARIEVSHRLPPGKFTPAKERGFPRFIFNPYKLGVI